MIKRLKNQNNEGFSLVELIIVIAILGILATLIGVNVIRYIDKGRQAIDINNAKLIKDAVTAHAYPSDYKGETVNYTDPETHESETYTRGWVYVDQNEIRCSDSSTALALIDAGLVNVSQEFIDNLTEAELEGNNWYPSSSSVPDGDYVGKTSIGEYLFVNKIKVKSRTAWNTYQLDVYIDDIGELHLGASASNTIRKGGHEKDVKTAQYFAERVGCDGSKATPIGSQNSSR